MRNWNLQCDVVVVGSGGSALTAAILAHDNNAKTVVLEKSGLVGGTTAVSGGALWTPMNSHMKDLDISDSREEALAYCKKLAEEGMLCKDTHEHSIRISPPLIITKGEVDWALERLRRVLKP